jgi:hypothetical protein
MKIITYLLSLIIILSSCKKKDYFNGPNFFQDNFENYTTLNDLLFEKDQLWSFTQITREENNITVDTVNFHSGKKSLKFNAKKTTNGNASKSSIVKQNMAYWNGQTVRITAWYYIKGTESINWLFLLDLEEQTAVGAGPGMRLALVNNQLRVEYKFFEDDILQPAGKEIELPRNEWVELIWEIKLSTKYNGTVKLWQNGQLIIDAKNKRTLPKDFLYFQQGTKGMYSSIEIGITANSADNDLTLWVDDIKFEKTE